MEIEHIAVVVVESWPEGVGVVLGPVVAVHSPGHLVCASEGSDGLGVDKHFAFGHALEHHSEVESLPLCGEVESVEIASVAVAQAHEVAVVFLCTVASTHLVVDASVGIGQCEVAHVAAAHFTVGERLVARMRLFILIVLLEAAPVAVGGISPDGVHGISLEQAHGTRRDDIRSVVLLEFVLRVAQVESHLIAEVADAVSPFDFEFPSPGFQFTHIDSGHADTDGVRQLQAGEHVVVVLPVIVEGAAEPSVEHAEVDTHIGGLDGFPCLVFRSEVGLVVALLGDIGGSLRDGGHIVVESQHGAIAQLSPRCAQFEVAHPVECEPFLLVHPPCGAYRGEGLPSLGGSQSRASVVAYIGLEEVSFIVVVIDTSEVRHHGPGLNIVGQRYIAGFGGVEVVEREEVV